jgi:hypothetical protein
LKSAAKAGHLDAVKFLLDRAKQLNREVNDDILKLAMQSGCLDLIIFLIDPNNGFNVNLTSCTIDDVIASGNIAVLKYIQSAGFYLSYDLTMQSIFLFKDIIKRDHVDLILFIFNPYNHFHYSPIMRGSETLGDSATMRSILVCEVSFTDAISHLELARIDSAESQLSIAANSYTILYIIKVMYALTHPETYPFNDECIQMLIEHFLSVIASRFFVPTEKQTINTLLPGAIAALQASGRMEAARLLEKTSESFLVYSMAKPEPLQSISYS